MAVGLGKRLCNAHSVLVVVFEGLYFPSLINKTPVEWNTIPSSLNSVFMLEDCVGKTMSSEVVLRYGYCKSVNMPIFGCKATL